jgi:hypothetical protein
MDTETGGRWVVAILVVAAIVALVLFARGTPDHGKPTSSPTAVAVELERLTG